MGRATALREQGGVPGEAGFTLIEILVALTILSIALAVLFGIFGQDLARSRETQARMAARTLANALLAEAETSPELSFGASAGRTGSGLEWRLSVRPYGTDKDRQAWPARAAELSATVTWGDRGTGQILTLSTLHLLPKEPPS